MEKHSVLLLRKQGLQAPKSAIVKDGHLKRLNRPPRMEKKVKAFLVQKFTRAQLGGKRLIQFRWLEEMKGARYSSGKLQFKPEEWSTAQLTNVTITAPKTT